MAAFLCGVAAGWIVSFAMWFVWSFSLVEGLLVGALAGTAAIFGTLLVQALPRASINTQNRNSTSSQRIQRSDPEKVFF
jgi:hypothetical protein